MKYSSKNESTKVTYFNMDKFQKQGWPKVQLEKGYVQNYRSK